MLATHFNVNDQVYKYFIFKSNVKTHMSKAGEPNNCTGGGEKLRYLHMKYIEVLKGRLKMWNISAYMPDGKKYEVGSQWENTK